MYAKQELQSIAIDTWFSSQDQGLPVCQKATVELETYSANIKQDRERPISSEEDQSDLRPEIGVSSVGMAHVTVIYAKA